MKGRRIRSMVPARDENGGIRTKSTLDAIRPKVEMPDWEPPKTFRRIYYKDDSGERTSYREGSKAYDPEPAKVLFEVVGEDGTEQQLTKRQAKKAYSARQVRKALKNLARDEKRELRGKRDEMNSDLPASAVIR